MLGLLISPVSFEPGMTEDGTGQVKCVRDVIRDVQLHPTERFDTDCRVLRRFRLLQPVPGNVVQPVPPAFAFGNVKELQVGTARFVPQVWRNTHGFAPSKAADAIFLMSSTNPPMLAMEANSSSGK